MSLSTHALPPTGAVALASEGPFSLGLLDVHPAIRQVSGPGFDETLEPRVMQALVVLARARESVVSRDVLTMTCWDGRVVGEDAINRVISRLRRLAERCPGASFTLETITKVGYRLREQEAESLLSSPVLTGEVSAQPTEGARPKLRVTAPARIIVAALTTAALIAALAVWQPWRAPPSADYAAARAAMDRNTAEDNAHAVVLLQGLVAAEPGNADAWSALGLAYYEMLEFTPPDAQPGLSERAGAAADRALQLDPGQAEAEAVRALLTPAVNNWQEADRVQAAALERAPMQRQLLAMRGFFFAGSGRIHASLDYFARENALPPTSPRTLGQYAFSLAANHQLEEADQLLDEGARRWPRNISIYFTRFWMNVFSGRAGKALAIIDDAGDRPTGIPPEEFDLYRAAALAFATHAPADIAAALQRHGEAARKGQGYAQNAIRIAAGLGDLDLAFALANALYLHKGDAIPRRMFSGAQGQYARDRALPVFYLFDPVTAPMRRDPRFIGLMESLGLGDYWRSTGAWPDFCTDEPDAKPVCDRLRAGP